MMNHWMFNCRDISDLISRSYDEPLPLRVRMGIKIHLMMCRLCTRYKNQLDLIQDALEIIKSQEPDQVPDKKLPDDIKDRLKNQLN